MSAPENASVEVLRAALEEMTVKDDILQRIAADPASIKLNEIGLDSKELLLLDFHLEEASGLNINFDAIRDDMTVVEFLAEIAPAEQ